MVFRSIFQMQIAVLCPQKTIIFNPHKALYIRLCQSTSFFNTFLQTLFKEGKYYCHSSTGHGYDKMNVRKVIVQSKVRNQEGTEWPANSRVQGPVQLVSPRVLFSKFFYYKTLLQLGRQSPDVAYIVWNAQWSASGS